MPRPYRDSAATFSNGTTTLENSHYRVTINSRGAITELADKTDGNRQWVLSGGAGR